MTNDRDQRLQEIRGRVEYYASLGINVTDVRWLLAEIERLEKKLGDTREHQWSDLEKLALSFRDNF